MDNAWQRYLEAASGLTKVTARTAEAVVQGLVRQGELAADKAERYVDELLVRSEENRKAIGALVRSETERAVARLGLARQQDLDLLAARVASLESRSAAAPQGPQPRPEGPGKGRKSAAERRADTAGQATSGEPAEPKTMDKRAPSASPPRKPPSRSDVS